MKDLNHARFVEEKQVKIHCSKLLCLNYTQCLVKIGIAVYILIRWGLHQKKHRKNGIKGLMLNDFMLP